MSKKAVSLSIVLVLLVFCVSCTMVWSHSYNKRKTAAEYIHNYCGQDHAIDPWGTSYRVTKDSDEGVLTVTITSAGPDGHFDTKDDIRGGYRKSVSIEIK